MVISVPNVAHLSVSVPLLLRRFEYADGGILDRTHMRFFVEKSALRLVNGAGLAVTQGLLLGFDGPRTRLLNALTFGLLRHHLTQQYVMLAEPAAAPSQAPVRWQIGAPQQRRAEAQPAPAT